MAEDLSDMPRPDIIDPSRWPIDPEPVDNRIAFAAICGALLFWLAITLGAAAAIAKLFIPAACS